MSLVARVIPTSTWLRRAQAVAVPDPEPGESYADLMDDLEWGHHIPFDDASGSTATASTGANGSYDDTLGAIEYVAQPITTQDPSGACIGLDGGARITVANSVSSATWTAHIVAFLDRTKTKHIIWNLGGSTNAAGEVSLEVLAGGQLRQWTRNAAGSSQEILGTAGDVPYGETVTIDVVQVSHATNGGRWIYVNGVLKVANVVVKEFPALPTDRTWFIGDWDDRSADYLDGLVAHWALKGAELSVADLQTVALPQQVCIANGFAAGTVPGGLTSQIDLLPHVHAKMPTTQTIVAQAEHGDASHNGDRTIAFAADSPESNEADQFSFRVATPIPPGLLSETAICTLTVGAVSSGAFTVPVAPSAVSGGEIFVSSGVGAGAATAGNDTTGDGTVGTPYATIGKAVTEAPSSNATIVLRKGIHRVASLALSGKTNLTIKGYSVDIDADPLVEANWPRIDGGIDMSTVTWELVHAGRQEYRTTAGSLIGTSNKIGCVIYPGTDPYRIPRWEPAGGMFKPDALVRLPPYWKQGSGSAEWSFEALRAGAATQILPHVYYHGPGVALDSSNRVTIRLQPQDSFTTAGLDFDIFGGDYDPDSHTIYLWAQDRQLFSSVGSGLTLEGLFIRNYDKLWDSSAPNVKVLRCVVWPGHHQDTQITLRSGASNFLTQHTVWESGLSYWHIWGSGKHSGYFDHVGANYGRQTPFFLDGTITNFRALDCLFLDVFDVVFGDVSNTTTIEIGYCAIDVTDDVCQLSNQTKAARVHHCFVLGPLYGDQGGGAPSSPQKYVDHNVCIMTRWRIHRPSEICGWMPYTPHSTGGNDAKHWYQNTIIYTNPNKDNIEQASNLSFPHPDQGYASGANGPHHQMNDIMVVVNKATPGAYSGSSLRNISSRWYANDGARDFIHDGNGYHQVLLNGKSSGPLFRSIRNTVGSPAAEHFNDLAAWLASAKFTASKNRYAPGFEANSVQGDPQFLGGSSAFTHDGYEVPPAFYIPQAAAYLSGAVNLTGFGWPDAGNPGYRGALNPAGDGTEIGPRAAS